MSILARVVGSAMLLGEKSLRSQETLTEIVSGPRPDAPVTRTARGRVTVRRSRVAALTVTEFVPRARRRGPTLLYLHGGAFVAPIQSAHWSIVGTLLSGDVSAAVVPSYPLIPEGSAATVIPRLLDLYADIVGRGGPVVVAGDSAGATLAVNLAQRTAAAGLPPPSTLLLYSPWLDLGVSNPLMRDIECRDPVLSREGLACAGRSWAAPVPPTDPEVSPIHGDLSMLPETHVYQGGRDILAPDAEDFVAAARRAGSPAHLHLYPDAFHCFVGARWLPESRHALRHSVRLL
ncbi:MAG: alpha/beta hydrolase fold domain-containing protein [Gordonia paraffinivorans]